MFNIIILGITSLLTDISSEMIYPLLPLYLVSRLGVGPAILGLIEGFAESLASLTKVFSGYFSDRIKRRKPFTVFGYGFSLVGKILFFLSTSWAWVFAGRLSDRFGKGVRTAPRDALIAESSDKARRGFSFGMHRAMDTLGAAIGVAIAYLLLISFHFDYRRIFLISIIPAGLGVVFLFAVREKGRAPDGEAEGSARLSFKWSALDRRLKAFLIITTIFSLGNSSNQFLLLRAKDLGFSAAAVILLYLVYNLSFALFAWPASGFSDKIGRKKVLVAGYLLYAVVYFGFARIQSPSAAWVLFVMYGLYSAFTEGAEKALVADVSSPELKGTTLGLHAALVGLALLPASILAGLLWKFLGAPAPFYFGGILSLAAALGMWFLI